MVAPRPNEEAADQTTELTPPGLARRLCWLCALVLSAAVLVKFEHTVCPFANLTGYPCPGCGMTRAALALMSLRFEAAMAYHPLSVLCVPIAGLLGVRGAQTYLLGRSPRWGGRLDAVLGRAGILRRQGLIWGALTTLLVGLWCARALGALGGPVEVSPIAGGLLF